MPAVLEYVPQDKLACPPLPDTNNPEPLYIKFSYGYVPTGSFCGLITQLVSVGPEGIFGFKWDLVEDGVKRNCISFHVDCVNKVTLLCHDRCYELRVTRNDPDVSLHDLCTHVLSVTLYILKKLYKDLKPRIAFQCPCSKHSTQRDISNLCTLDIARKVRFICENNPVMLRDTQQTWLGKVN